MQRVDFLLPDKDLIKIDTLIDDGYYSSRSEFIRSAIKKLLYNETKVQNFERLTQELMGKVEPKKLAKALEKAKEKGRARVKELMR